jgi:SAM-dependent methyltransferase
MEERIDLFESTYSHFMEDVLSIVRQETFGVDIGQNSWLTVDEYDRLLQLLSVGSQHHVLEVACGAGGPALHVAARLGCRVTGVDLNESAVNTASLSAVRSNQMDRVRFDVADAEDRLAFDDDSFDGVLCMDSMNHFLNRLAVLREWQRVLRKGCRAVFTDPVVITGPVTNEELAVRSSTGRFLFVPRGLNERLIEQAGLTLVTQQDVTDNAAAVAGRWHEARARHRDALMMIEGEDTFERFQRFYAVVHLLTKERRLSRIAYVVAKLP